MQHQICTLMITNLLLLLRQATTINTYRIIVLVFYIQLDLQLTKAVYHHYYHYKMKHGYYRIYYYAIIS